MKKTLLSLLAVPFLTLGLASFARAGGNEQPKQDNQPKQDQPSQDKQKQEKPKQDQPTQSQPKQSEPERDRKTLFGH